MYTVDNLHLYQLEVIEFAKEKKKCGLFLDMSLGKTVSSLTVAASFLASGFVKKVLVIAPLKVANKGWKQEAEKWEHLKHLKIKISTGDKKKRIKAFNEDAEMNILCVNNTEWACKQKIDTEDCMLIIDESSKFKNPSSGRFKALRKKEFKSVVLLSGTPSPNGMKDLWSQIYLIDKGERLGRTMGEFLERFFICFNNGSFSLYKIRSGADKIIMDLIKDICISKTAEDYLKMPKKIFITKKVILPPTVEEQCEELKEMFFLSLKDVDIEVFTGSALLNKLLQFSNGFLYDDEGKEHFIHDEKIKAMREIIDQNPNENFFVAYQFRADLVAIKKAFPEAVQLDREGEKLDDWNAGKIKILLAHPKSAGHGLNAQFGGSCIIWFGLSWNLEEYLQFNARLYRQGQKKDVRIFKIVTKTDKKVDNVLNNKDKKQKDLINFLKR